MEETQESYRPIEDVTVSNIHGIFNELPRKCKPRDILYPKVEWVPLSAIIVARGQ